MHRRRTAKENLASDFTPLEKRLLNEFQHGFPLTSQPYSELAEKLDTDEQNVIEALERLQQNGTISRVGPVLKPNRVGASTLAAMAVPADDLERIAGLVSARPEVNHNYERLHEYNLWFVVTASSEEHLYS
ncbi:MAG: Lrp/AsnC family transcriptional regulator, partial [Candidatus Sedimenticola sp. 20ELBAFRAG]